MKLLLLAVLLTALLGAVLLKVGANDQSVSADVQVAVRQLSDGRIEFAIVHDGAFHYPRTRVIRPALDHSRWLRSSPVRIEVPLPQIGRSQLDQTLARVESSCGRQLSYLEDWQPSNWPYTVTHAQDERAVVGQQREACHRELNIALEIMTLASLQETIDSETALQYTVSFDTTRMISDWTYQQVLDLIANHTIGG